MAMDPRALRRLAADRHIVVVSGTNGKTTTSHMVAAALRALGPVAHNASGSNMADGAVAALSETRGARWAVLEVDELHLIRVASSVDPAAIVVLNLTRDQLDRAAEVRKTAEAINQAVQRCPNATVFANADDPMTVWAVRSAARTIWVSAGAGWRGDTAGCPSCGRGLTESDSGWRCDCGRSRPTPTWRLDEDIAHGPGVSRRLAPKLPGEVNRGNALMALAVAIDAGVGPSEAATSICALDRIAGRYARITIGAHTVRLLLAKNPAGWAATLPMLGEHCSMLLAVNAREADGRDTSWLWDVDFEQLTGREVVACGERASDLGVRLSYAMVSHVTVRDPLAGLARLPPGEVDVVANYTAFRALERRLQRTR